MLHRMNFQTFPGMCCHHFPLRAVKVRRIRATKSEHQTPRKIWLHYRKELEQGGFVRVASWMHGVDRMTETADFVTWFCLTKTRHGVTPLRRDDIGDRWSCSTAHRWFRKLLAFCSVSTAGCTSLYSETLRAVIRRQYVFFSWTYSEGFWLRC